MTHPFNREYFPPAPSLPVTLLSADTQRSVGPFVALVDTGTDTTTVPIAFLERIQPKFLYSAFVRPHWGSRFSVSVFSVDVRIAEWTLPGVEVVADEMETDMILGRDVLNKLRLLLDGPAQTTEILEVGQKHK